MKQQIKILLAEWRLHELIQTESSNVYRLTTILLAPPTSFYWQPWPRGLRPSKTQTAAQYQEPGPEAVNPLSHSTQPNMKLPCCKGKKGHRPECMEAHSDPSLSFSRPTGCKIFKVSLCMCIYQGICSFGGSGGPQFTFLYHPYHL